MKLYEISDAIRQALDHIELDEETGEILSADELHAEEDVMKLERRVKSDERKLAKESGLLTKIPVK